MSGIIGMTSGCFDLIHIGHIRYLERCKALCNKLIVGVDGNKLVAKSKGATRPIIDEKERLEMINSLSCVDSGFIADHMGAFKDIVVQFGVNIIFKSERYQDMDLVYGVDDVPIELRPRLEIIHDVPDLKSTTWIVSKIKGIV